MHAQADAWQVSYRPVHAVVQLPQCMMSRVVSTQLPSHIAQPSLGGRASAGESTTRMSASASFGFVSTGASTSVTSTGASRVGPASGSGEDWSGTEDVASGADPWPESTDASSPCPNS